MSRTRKITRHSTNAVDIATRIAGLAAKKLFQATGPLLSPRQITEQHLDMLQMSDIGIHTRLCISEASDAIRTGDYGHPSVARCFEAFNQRCGRPAV